MSKVSFEEIGAVTATFYALAGVTPGQTVKLSANSQVGPCAAGDAFCGVALSNKNGCAGVQMRGFVTVAITGAVELGQKLLAADGSGGAKAVTTGGTPCLVVSVDTVAKTAVVCL